MSSSPVVLLEGWRLNQTRGFSALVTSAEGAPVAGVVSPAGGVLLSAVVVPPPQAARPSVMAAARDSARIFFMTILLFLKFRRVPSFPACYSLILRHC